MTERKLGEVIVWESEPLVDKITKAKAAAQLGRVAMKVGISKKEAGDRAMHELKHALADRGTSGQMMLFNFGNGKYGFCYRPNRAMSLDEEQIGLMAPGYDMSETDKKRLEMIRIMRKSGIKQLT